MFEIRKATLDDALGITIVNVYTWKMTYTGLMPDELIDIRIQELKKLARKRKNEIKKKDNFIVASVEKVIVGFCSYGKSRNELFANSAEINSLYVLAGFQGEGIGRELLLEAMRKLKDMGYSSIIINCLQGNPAIEFYKKMGGSIVSKRVDTIKDVSMVEEIVYIKM